MASSATVFNKLPSKLEVDHKAVEKQRAAENAAQAERIQHEREVKLADDKRQQAERENISMARKTEDLESNLERTVHEKMAMEQINHDLKVDKDRLQHNLDNEVRRCQRETECSNALVGWARNRVLRVVVIGHYWEQTENMKIRLTKSQDHEEVETLEIARV